MVWLLAGQKYLITCWAVGTVGAITVSALPCSYRRLIILWLVVNRTMPPKNHHKLNVETHMK